MRFLAIFLLFCFAVVGATLLAKVSLREEVERELERRAKEILTEAGFPGVVVDFDHLDGRIGGTVDRPEDVPVVESLLQEQLPTAYWPEGAVALGIRPTLPPEISLQRPAGEEAVRIEGRLAQSDESGRTLLGSRIHALSNVASVDNALRLDPTVLPFAQMAELASLSAELLSHPGAVELSLRENTLSLSAHVPNEGVKENVLALAEKAGAKSVVDRLRVTPPVAFTRWSELIVTRNRFGLTLRGVVPTEEDRAQLRALFSPEGTSVVTSDRLEVVESCGRSPWQDAISRVAPAMLSQLQGEMTAEFTRTQVRVSGRVADETAQTNLNALLSLLKGEGAELEVHADLSLAPSTPGRQLKLIAQYEGNQLLLKGSGLEAAFAQALETKLAAVLPDLRVLNELDNPEDPVREDWLERLPAFFAEALPRLAEAKVEMNGNEVLLEGRTLAQPDRQAVENLAINSFPRGFRIRNRLQHAASRFPQPALMPEERTQLAESLKALPVYFDRGSDALKAGERNKVKEVADLILGAKGPIELILRGVSDNVGNSESNKQLSLRRAESVRQELVRLGLSEASLAVEAEEEDISQVPRSEQWKSRRVEITLKESPTP